MADNREHDREATKLCFEFFKHFTTITTAVALVGLALIQRFELRSEAVGGGIVVLGISLLLSIVGMLSVAIPAAFNDELPKMGILTILLLVFTPLFFVFGVVMFASATAPPRPRLILSAYPSGNRSAKRVSENGCCRRFDS